MDKCHANGNITMTAGGALAKGDIVKFSSGKVIKTTGLTDLAIGVALDSADGDGAIVPIAVLGNYTGTVQIKAGGAISQGAQITANATATAAATDVIIGVALEAAAASGDMIEIIHAAPHVK